MAYVSKELKAELAPNIKAVLKKYNMKGTISVRHHSVLVVTVRSGVLDIIGNGNEMIKLSNKRRGEDRWMVTDYDSVNHHTIDRCYTNEVKDFLLELKDAMMDGNHNNSDIMTDYFDVGWYIDINIGTYEKPYNLIK